MLSVIDMFTDKVYLEFKFDKGCCYNGTFYKENYYCNHSEYCIRMYDLVNKSIIKEIPVNDYKLFEFVVWSERYLLLGATKRYKGYGGIFVIDLDNYKIDFKKLCNKDELYGAKKIKLKALGECLVLSSSEYCLLFGLNDYNENGNLSNEKY